VRLGGADRVWRMPGHPPEQVPFSIREAVFLDFMVVEECCHLVPISLDSPGEHW